MSLNTHRGCPFSHANYGVWITLVRRLEKPEAHDVHRRNLLVLFGSSYGLKWIEDENLVFQLLNLEVLAQCVQFISPLIPCLL